MAPTPDCGPRARRRARLLGPAVLAGLLALATGCGGAPGRAVAGPTLDPQSIAVADPTLDAEQRSQLAAPPQPAPARPAFDPCSQLTADGARQRLAAAGVAAAGPSGGGGCSVTGPDGFEGLAHVEVLDSVTQAREFFADPQWDGSLAVDGPVQVVYGIGDEADVASQGGPGGWSVLVARRGATVLGLFSNQGSRSACERTAAAILASL